MFDYSCEIFSFTFLVFFLIYSLNKYISKIQL